MDISFIVAHDLENGIGINGDLPWHSPKDFQFFRQKTFGHNCIVGRTTYENIFDRRKDKIHNNELLPGRKCHLLSSSLSNATGCESIFDSFDKALAFCRREEQVFIIGGSQVYKNFLPYVTSIYATTIHYKYKCDAFFEYPNMEDFHLMSKEIHHDETLGYNISFNTYRRIDHGT